MSCSALVRLACEDDLPEVLALARATAEAPHWREAVYQEYVAAAINSLQDKALLVAVANGCVRGFAAAAMVAGDAELESVAVAEAVRRTGCGGQLLEGVQTWARQKGAHGLLLEVRAANTGAQAFYGARGFRTEGLRRGYYKGPVDDAVLMRKSLRDE